MVWRRNEEKEHYCYACRKPKSFIAKAIDEIKKILITYGLVFFVLFGFLCYYLAKDPSKLLDMQTFFMSYIGNNQAGYSYNKELKDYSVSIILSDYGITEVTRIRQVQALESWVYNNIHYIQDNTYEHFSTPIETLETGYGDCDDKSILFCGLARQIGIECYVKCNNNHCWSVIAYWDDFNNEKCHWYIDATNNIIENIKGCKEDIEVLR